MISNDHKKHADITRATFGNFGRTEFALTGTSCSNIRNLCAAVIARLGGKYRCAYVDASHREQEAADVPGAFITYTEKSSYREFQTKETLDSFRCHQLFNESDLILVNGNHHQAARQVLVIDKQKEASLEKKIDQFKNVELLILADDTEDIFGFVKRMLPHWQELPLLRMQDTDAITSFFERRVIETVSRINGLVLAGGRSTRLGYDKSAITWFGKEQRYYAADLLRPYCAEVFISCRNEQEKDIDSRYRTLTDTFTGLGPYGAILSAFRQQPDDAWLVLACDLPLIDVHTIEQLVKRRNPSAVATTFESPYDHLPEPLITIWEPKAYPVLLSFLAQGYSCPRKVLRNNDVEIIQTDNPDVLMNVNTPEEVEKVKKKLLDKSTAI